jgi:hypothetical protein
LAAGAALPACCGAAQADASAVARITERIGKNRCIAKDLDRISITLMAGAGICHAHAPGWDTRAT